MKNSDSPKTVYVDLLAIEPFKYWRGASMAAVVAAVALAVIPPRHDSLVMACVVMAIGWALCDVFAWRDLCKMGRDAVLREGFERGAQWAIIDMAHTQGNLHVVGGPGSTGETVHDLLRSLFVPKETS